ncbi:MAG: CTP synthase [Chloroflexi bacterium]|nr:CTP synthase [Chloroflexota bacterium]
MTRATRIGIAGDYNADNPTHTATDAALAHAAAHLSLAIEARWLPTDEIVGPDGGQLLAECDGVLISPGSPYRNMAGALRAIRYAREADVPLIGACGGLQHMVIEYARNVLGVADAAHAESDPDASHLFITPLSCSLFGQTMNVTLRPGTRAQAYYAADGALENYYCNFGLNPAYRGDLEAAGLCVSGIDADGEPRIFELPDHRFFIGTLFVPQTRSTPEQPHPLITAFVAAASRTMELANAEQGLTTAPSL